MRFGVAPDSLIACAINGLNNVDVKTIKVRWALVATPSCQRPQCVES